MHQPSDLLASITRLARQLNQAKLRCCLVNISWDDVTHPFAREVQHLQQQYDQLTVNREAGTTTTII